MLFSVLQNVFIIHNEQFTVIIFSWFLIKNIWKTHFCDFSALFSTYLINAVTIFHKTFFPKFSRDSTDLENLTKLVILSLLRSRQDCITLIFLLDISVFYTFWQDMYENINFTQCNDLMLTRNRTLIKWETWNFLMHAFSLG